METQKICKTCKHRKVRKCTLYNEALSDINKQPEFCKMTLHKIDQAITGFKVVTKDDVKKHEVKAAVETKSKIKATPEYLIGARYHIKPPNQDYAMFVEFFELDGKPFEMFINCKNPEHFQWLTALTRVISFVFRNAIETGNSDKVAKELSKQLKEIFDPKGGHWKKGGVFCPSLVAEIGYCLEDYMNKLNGVQDIKKDFPDNAVLCAKCNTKAAILMDGCMTCLNCGDSKCG